MRPAILLALLLLVAGSASAQWERVDPNFPVTDLWATNLVAGDETHAYATALVGQPTPSRFAIFRSPDDGASWTEVFSGYNGGATGLGLAKSDGQWVLLVRGSGETALLRSDDGVAWAEAPARIPVATSTSVAKLGTTYVVVGGTTSYRSTDGGATWTAFGTGQPMGSVRAFAGGFSALNGIGQLFRLDGDAWTGPIAFGAPNLATSIAIDGGRLWVKGAAGALASSADGTTWQAETTDRPVDWGAIQTTAAGPSPWFLPGAQAVFVSTDDGATVTDVTGNYPVGTAGFLCGGNHGASATAAYANLLCSFSDPSRNGVYRYRFAGATSAADAPGPGGLGLAVGGNPTARGGTVRLTLAAATAATVDVFDVRGRRVARLAEGPQPAGTTVLALPAGLAPGVYVVRATAGAEVARATLTVVR